MKNNNQTQVDKNIVTTKIVTNVSGKAFAAKTPNQKSSQKTPAGYFEGAFSAKTPNVKGNGNGKKQKSK